MVTFIELAFASACASVRAPTINETATSGAAENCSAAVLRSTPNWFATDRPFALGKMPLRDVPIVLAIVVARTAREK